MREATRQLDLYRDAVTRIQNGDYNSALTKLLDHQVFLDKHAVPPCSHFTDVQEAIGYCYNYLGNIVEYKSTKEQLPIDSSTKPKSINLKKKKRYVNPN